VPKRSTHTFESEKDGVHEESMHSAYCLYCGACCLVSDKPLELLPRRHTDGAHVLDTRPSEAEGQKTLFYRLLARDEPEPQLVRRAAGVEKQWRLSCLKCSLFIAYRHVPAPVKGAPPPPLTFVLDRALGPHPSTLDESSIPKCIQPISTRAVRVAFEMTVGAPNPGISAISDSEVVVNLRAHHMREGANSELLELVSRALRLPRHKLQLTRGWSFKSKFVLVNGMARGEVYQRLRAVVDTTDGSYARRNASTSRRKSAAAAVFDVGQGDAADGEGAAPALRGMGDAARAGAMASSIREQWEAGNNELDLEMAPPPDKRYKATW
jgi:uncharacterized protein YggU (UPF0235/DUF167 family)